MSCTYGNFSPVGGTGDQHALPYLLNCLKDSQLSAAAFDAIYAIFVWHPDPEITALMNQACRMIAVKDAAVPLLDRIIQLQPEYYEVRLHCCMGSLHHKAILHLPFLFVNCLSHLWSLMLVGAGCDQSQPFQHDSVMQHPHHKAGVDSACTMHQCCIAMAETG